MKNQTMKITYSKHYIAPSIRAHLIAALDAMGVALASHDHVWKASERRKYERSVRILTWPDDTTS